MNASVTPWVTRDSAYLAEYSRQVTMPQLLTATQIVLNNSQSERWDSIIESIAKMQWLKRKWDGDCAIPPTGSLIASVIDLAKYLKSKDDLPPTRVSPIVDGGIALEWQVGNEFYHYEFFTPYIAEVFTSIPGTKPKYEEIDFKEIATSIRGSRTNQSRDQWSQPQPAPALLSRLNMCIAGF